METALKICNTWQASDMNIRKKIFIFPNTKLQKVIVNSDMEIKFNLMTYRVTSNSRRPTGEQVHQIFQFNSY